MQYQPDQASMSSFLFNPGPLYSVATRQDEAGYGLEYRDHIVLSTDFVLIDREDCTGTN
jgi:hypothetical protein